MSSDKPPSALSLSQNTNPSNGSSPRASLLNGSSNGGSLSKVKTPTGSNTPTSVSQVLPNPQQSSQAYSSAQQSNSQYSYGNDNSGYMNSSSASQYGGLDFGSHQHHLSQGQPPTPQTATSFPPQPPALQPAYPQHNGIFPPFPFSSPHGVSSPAGQPGVSGPLSSVHHPQQLLPLPQATQLAPSPASLSGISAGGPQTPVSATASAFNNHQFDTTGQVAPPGMKPRVAATLWEDEGSLCFQVEAKGVCVARREDNHMINGTKLLNVAGMTRGRRDGILKSEKVRHVVKIGPMHLKGVWIPFERALDFANKEKITELLYPLFVHNIGAFLYHPTNTHRTNAVMAAAQRRRADNEVLQQSQALNQQSQMQRRNQTDLGMPSSQPPPLHHPGMHNPLHSSLPPHSSLSQPRPGIERSMSFPTPPSSASSVMGVGSSNDSSFWNGSMVSAVPGSGSQSLAIDTVMNSRSMPTTPATTPPGGTMQQMQQYPPPTSSVYSSSNSSMSQQNIAQQNMQRFSQPIPQSSQYMNQGREPSTMGPPPTSRGHAASLSRPSSRQNTSDDGHAKEDAEEQNGLVGEADDHVVQEVQHGDEEGENEAEHDHDEEYTTHDGSNYTNGHRSGVTVDGSSGATPRTTSQQWNGYSTPPRGGSGNRTAIRQPPARDIYQQFGGENAQDHSESNGTGATDNGYQAQSGLGVSMPSQTPPQPYGGLNGSSTPSSNKRMREMDNEEEHGSRPSSRGHDDRPGDADSVNGIKRRKTIREGSVGGIGSNAGFDRNSDGRLSRTRSAIVPRARR